MVGYRTAHSQFGKLVNMNPVPSTSTSTSTSTIPTRKQHRSPTTNQRQEKQELSEYQNQSINF